MHTTIKFAKVNPNATIPSKEIEDMGYDIYSCFSEDNFIINLFHRDIVVLDTFKRSLHLV